MNCKRTFIFKNAGRRLLTVLLLAVMTASLTGCSLLESQTLRQTSRLAKNVSHVAGELSEKTGKSEKISGGLAELSEKADEFSQQADTLSDYAEKIEKTEDTIREKASDIKEKNPELAEKIGEAGEKLFDALSDSLGYEPLTFRKGAYLTEHFEKHGAEFPYETETEYLFGANELIHNPEALHKKAADDGDDVYFLESTGEFAVVSSDGFIRTYFIPSAGIDYYNKQ